jgi:hypothetical protein
LFVEKGVYEVRRGAASTRIGFNLVFLNKGWSGRKAAEHEDWNQPGFVLLRKKHDGREGVGCGGIVEDDGGIENRLSGVVG